MRRPDGSADLDSGGAPRELRKSMSATSSGSSSFIPAAWQQQQQQQHQPARTVTPVSEDMASTSYPTTSWWEGCEDSSGGRDVMNAAVTMAREAEGALDFVLEGSTKSAGVLFTRYDMDLNGRLTKQDLYDLLLELNLALPYEEYQRLIDFLFAAADHDQDGDLVMGEFLPLYKLLCRARRAFKRQDHHCNGQIDRYDFAQLLIDLGALAIAGPSGEPAAQSAALGRGSGGSSQGGSRDGRAKGGAKRAGLWGVSSGAASGRSQQQQQQQEGRVKELVEHGFSMVDYAGRGTINFGQVLCWYGQYLNLQGGVPAMDEYGELLPLPPSGLTAPGWAS